MKKYIHNQAGFGSLWILIILVLIGVGGAGYYIYTSQQNDDEQTQETVEDQSAPEEESEPESTIPSGFALFQDADTGIQFLYRTNWGSPSMTRDDFSHDGESYSITFNNNQELRAGIKSTDFIYTDGPRGGFGAVGFGHTSFENHVANIQASDQARLDGSDSYDTTIIDESESHITYADFDMVAGGYLISSTLKLNNAKYPAVEFTYSATTPPITEENPNVLDYVEAEYIEEFQRLTNANSEL
ncbi:hypothetical protein BH23PAT2_BH23PAT2_03910 [soil metagenome]